jgi:hypothetical protein
LSIANLPTNYCTSIKHYALRLTTTNAPHTQCDTTLQVVLTAAAVMDDDADACTLLLADGTPLLLGQLLELLGRDALNHLGLSFVLSSSFTVLFLSAFEILQVQSAMQPIASAKPHHTHTHTHAHAHAQSLSGHRTSFSSRMRSRRCFSRSRRLFKRSRSSSFFFHDFLNGAHARLLDVLRSTTSTTSHQ